METYILTYTSTELSPDYCSFDRYGATKDYEYNTKAILAKDYADAKANAWDFLNNEASYFGYCKFVALNWVKRKVSA